MPRTRHPILYESDMRYFFFNILLVFIFFLTLSQCSNNLLSPRGRGQGEGELKVVSPVQFLKPSQSCRDVWEEKKITSQDTLYSPERDGRDYETFYNRLDRNNCVKEWSVFIFMNADNDLSDYSYLDLHEMESLGSTLDMDVIVQLDTAQNTGSKRLHIAHDSRPYEQWNVKDVEDFDESKIFSPVIELLPEINSGTKGALEDFLNFSFQKYPAKHYAVIIWSHGMGWDAQVSEEFKAVPTHLDLSGVEKPLSDEELVKKRRDKSRYRGGISFDESTDDRDAHLLIPELRSVLSHMAAFYLNGEPIDVYGSDACLMQMVEVAYEFKKQVRYIVGSANMEGKMGWPYRDIFSHLDNTIQKYKTDDQADTAQLWVREIPRLYRDSYASEDSSQGYDKRAIMTVIFAHDFKRYFISQLTEFGRALMEYLKEDPALEGKRYDAVRYLIGQTFTYSGLSQDLYYFSILINQLVSKNKEDERTPGEVKLKQAVMALQDAITYVAPAFAASDYYYEPKIFGATRGLAVWLPASNEEYKEKKDIFHQSKIYRMDDFWSKEAPGWGDFNAYIHSKSGFQGLGPRIKFP